MASETIRLPRGKMRDPAPALSIKLCHRTLTQVTCPDREFVTLSPHKGMYFGRATTICATVTGQSCHPLEAVADAQPSEATRDA